MIIRYLIILLIVAAAMFLWTKDKDVATQNSQNFEKETTSQTPSISNQQNITTIANNLDVPWALAFLPNGNILVTERKGKVKLIDKNKNFQVSEIAQINDVRQSGEGGLHGIAVDPNFSNNNYVFVYYTYQNEGSNTLNRVVRYRYVDNKLTDPTIIVDKIPGALFHDGGRIKFGPDNLLYIATGDAQEPSLAQNVKSLAGKILRVNNNNKAEVYSYGHRNPQGITWDKNGRLWATEHGSSACDEVNLVEKGKNYGWPDIRCDEKRNGMVTPIINSQTNTWAPGGAAFYKDSIFFAGLRGEALFEYNINHNSLNTYFKNQFGRIREVVLGPDNMLYITTSNHDGRGMPQPNDDKIIRLNPEKL